jgi:phage shock protein PspC (stress-responsive transcriptional regulator)
MGATTNDPAQADPRVWIVPSPWARIVSIAGPVALGADAVLLAMGHSTVAYLIAMVVFWVAAIIAMPPDRGEPESLEDRSHEDWKATKRSDVYRFAIFFVLIVGCGGLYLYLDIDPHLADLLEAILWLGLAAFQSAVLAYRVWWKRRLPG